MKNCIFSLFLSVFILIGCAPPVAAKSETRQRPKVEIQIQAVEIQTVSFIVAVAPQEGIHVAQTQRVQGIVDFLISSGDANRQFLSIKTLSLNYSIGLNLIDNPKKANAQRGLTIFQSQPLLEYGNNYLS